MSSLAVQRLGFKRRAALYSTLLRWWPGYPNSRRLHSHGPPPSRQQLTTRSAPRVSLQQQFPRQDPNANQPLDTENLRCKPPCATFPNPSVVRRKTGKQNGVKTRHKYFARFGEQFPSNSIPSEASAQSQRKPNRPDGQPSVSRNSPLVLPTAHLITAVI